MTARDEVLEAERRRAAAMVAGDVAALAACLDDELVYIHATGVQHGREQLLEYLGTGPRYEEVCLHPRRVLVCGEAALVFGDLQLRLVRANGDRVEARSLVTEAWVRRRQCWRLASFQSTRPT